MGRLCRRRRIRLILRSSLLLLLLEPLGLLLLVLLLLLGRRRRRGRLPWLRGTTCCWRHCCCCCRGGIRRKDRNLSGRRRFPRGVAIIEEVGRGRGKGAHRKVPCAVKDRAVLEKVAGAVVRGHFRHAGLLLLLVMLLRRWALVFPRHRTGRTVPAGLGFGDSVNQRLRATLDEDRNVPHRGLLLWLLLLGHLFLALPTTFLLLVWVNFALPPWSLARCPRVSCFLHQARTHTHTYTDTGAVDRERSFCLSVVLEKDTLSHTILHLFSAPQ